MKKPILNINWRLAKLYDEKFKGEYFIMPKIRINEYDMTGVIQKSPISNIIYIPIPTDEAVQLTDKGKVVSIKPFGAFVEIAPGKDGLVHISKLDHSRVENVEDVVSMGDEIVVKVMEVKDGKISLSRKDALEELKAKK